MKSELLTLIREKEEAVLLISVTIAQDHYLKNALEGKSHARLTLSKYSQTLKENTSLKNIWFQVIDAEGKSLYRSWTEKIGDSLLEARVDISKMILNPRIISSISTGKYDMTFKTIVPIFSNNKLIGMVETLAKFNSIVIKMQENDYKTLIVVDPKYKQQLTKAYTQTFIDDFYVASLESDKELMDLVSKNLVKNYLDIAEYRVDEKNSLLITLYKLPNINGENMAYFILAKDLNQIDVHSITESRDRIIMGLILGFIIITGFLSYLYIVNYRKYIEKQKKNLQEQVAFKTEALQRKSAELQYIANHDSLTNLPNRMLFLDRLKQLIKHSKRQEQSLAVLFLDLDRFKEINDTYGHEMGDKLLQAITKNLKDCVREEDTIARLGGDEFTIILQNISSKDTLKIADTILEKMQKPLYIKDIQLFVTFSVGISRYPEDGDSADLLVRNADTAMYHAKDKGKNNYQFYNVGMTDLAMKRVDLEKDIRRALGENEFEPYYQPKIDAKTLQVVGLEVLVRWNHPTKGLVPPFEFVPFAEEVGLIAEIDALTMKRALKQVKAWHDEGLQTGRLSLNISAKQLENKTSLKEFQQRIEDVDFDTNYLEFEITESQIMLNPKKAIEILHAIKKLGIKISVDDFGTGYSSLSYLKELPVDSLKIDRSFIIDVTKNEDDQAIVKIIIALAGNLHLDVIAEGVETQEQVDFLLSHGCNIIQGYFYSRPLASVECEAFLRSHP
jgi:diguanylate cyclase (GGDEF)-like protein